MEIGKGWEEGKSWAQSSGLIIDKQSHAGATGTVVKS